MHAMWPFGRKKVADRLGAVAVGEPMAVDVLTSVVSPNAVVSPVSGMRSALLQVELVERLPEEQRQNGAFSGGEGAVFDRFVSLGVALFLVLRDRDGDEISVVAGRARLDAAASRNGGTPLATVPAELVGFLRRATGRGVICYRELPLLEGDKVRLRAVVEPSQTVVTSGYRSGSKVRYLVRDDLAVVILEETVEAPAW